MPRHCAHPGCGIQPSLNMPYEVLPLYCKTHKTSVDMIDVVSTLCAHEGGCTTHPSRNFPGQTRPLMCLEHELPGMECVKNPRCQFPGCKIRPSHNVQAETRGKY